MDQVTNELDVLATDLWIPRHRQAADQREQEFQEYRYLLERHDLQMPRTLVCDEDNPNIGLIRENKREQCFT